MVIELPKYMLIRSNIAELVTYDRRQFNKTEPVPVFCNHSKTPLIRFMLTAAREGRARTMYSPYLAIDLSSLPQTVPRLLFLQIYEKLNIETWSLIPNFSIGIWILISYCQYYYSGIIIPRQGVRVVSAWEKQQRQHSVCGPARLLAPMNVTVRPHLLRRRCFWSIEYFLWRTHVSSGWPSNFDSPAENHKFDL